MVNSALFGLILGVALTLSIGTIHADSEYASTVNCFVGNCMVEAPAEGSEYRINTFFTSAILVFNGVPDHIANADGDHYKCIIYQGDWQDRTIHKVAEPFCEFTDLEEGTDYLVNVIPTGAQQSKLFDDIPFTTLSWTGIIYDLVIGTTSATLDFDDITNHTANAAGEHYKCIIHQGDWQDRDLHKVAESFCTFEDLEPESEYMVNVIPTGARQTKIFDDITFTTEKITPESTLPTTFDLEYDSTSATLEFDDVTDNTGGYFCSIILAGSKTDSVTLEDNSFCSFTDLTPNTDYVISVTAQGGIYGKSIFGDIPFTTHDAPEITFDLTVHSTSAILDFDDIEGHVANADGDHYKCIIH